MTLVRSGGGKLIVGGAARLQIESTCVQARPPPAAAGDPIQGGPL